MKIDNETIKYIANLSMIGISKEEEEKYSKDLEQILTYAEILDNLDTSKAAEFKNPLSDSNRFREDEIKESFDRNSILSNASDKEAGMIKVPKTFA